jgi:hypothetical protein
MLKILLVRFTIFRGHWNAASRWAGAMFLLLRLEATGNSREVVQCLTSYWYIFYFLRPLGVAERLCNVKNFIGDVFYF